MKPIPDLTISAADLWPGATVEHATQVVLALQSGGHRAYRVSSQSAANIGRFTDLIDSFWAAMMEVAETAVNEATQQQNNEISRLLQHAQDAHSLIMQQHNEAQAVLQSSAARLQELATINCRLQELNRAINHLQEPS